MLSLQKRKRTGQESKVQLVNKLRLEDGGARGRGELLT